MDGMQFPMNPTRVLAILQEKAADDPMLKAQVDAAMWQAVAMEQAEMLGPESSLDVEVEVDDE